MSYSILKFITSKYITNSLWRKLNQKKKKIYATIRETSYYRGYNHGSHFEFIQEKGRDK